MQSELEPEHAISAGTCNQCWNMQSVLDHAISAGAHDSIRVGTLEQCWGWLSERNCQYRAETCYLNITVTGVFCVGLL